MVVQQGFRQTIVFAKTSRYTKCKAAPNDWPTVPHSAAITVPVFKELPSLEIQEYESDEDLSDSNDEDFEIENDSVRKGFEQHEVDDLGLSKSAEQLLVSRLHEKNLLEKRAKVSYFRSRESAFVQYFRSDDGFVFCHNVHGLMEELGISAYNSTQWRLLIDSLKKSLKCVFLHNGYIFIWCSTNRPFSWRA
ncbi:hypothetical protein AVEN_183980-1 [Araneus ventricosus]|uniref:Uncharacterized protein n=1 Tax=Araneus ventricosus TaxID=182803 RepID=A0A4Y2E0A8_ARAVE|nr:hypothetical protein AVEN_183980-1 [Araneus ventricosus]